MGKANSHLAGEGAGAGAIIGFLAGGPLGAVIGAGIGGAAGEGIDRVGKPIERNIKENIREKDIIYQLDKYCRKKWSSITQFVRENQWGSGTSVYIREMGTQHDQHSLEISGIKFLNYVPLENLEKLVDKGYRKYNAGYTCGLNAINMSLRIWGYDKQMTLSQYSHKWAGLGYDLSGKWGMTMKTMYDYNIKNTFDKKKTKYSCEECDVIGTPSLNISFIDDTDYEKYTLMLVSGCGLKGHYILIIGVSMDKCYYLVTDQSQQVWLISYSAMKDNNMFYYRSNSVYSLVDVRSYYRLG